MKKNIVPFFLLYFHFLTGDNALTVRTPSLSPAAGDEETDEKGAPDDGGDYPHW